MKILSEEIPETLAGGIATGVLSLFILCVVTIYKSDEHMMSSFKEAEAQVGRDSEGAQKLGEFTNSTSPIMERSMDRVLHQARRNFTLAFTGLIVTFLLMTTVTVALFYPSLKKNLISDGRKPRRRGRKS